MIRYAGNSVPLGLRGKRHVLILTGVQYLLSTIPLTGRMSSGVVLIPSLYAGTRLATPVMLA